MNFDHRPNQRPVTQVKPVPQSPPGEDISPVPSLSNTEEGLELKSIEPARQKNRDFSVSEPSSPVRGGYGRVDEGVSSNELSNAEKIRSLRQSFASLF